MGGEEGCQEGGEEGCQEGEEGRQEGEEGGEEGCQEGEEGRVAFPGAEEEGGSEDGGKDEGGQDKGGGGEEVGLRSIYIPKDPKAGMPAVCAYWRAHAGA